MVVRTLAFMVVRQVLGLIRIGPSPEAKDVEQRGLYLSGPSVSSITTGKILDANRDLLTEEEFRKRNGFDR